MQGGEASYKEIISQFWIYHFDDCLKKTLRLGRMYSGEKGKHLEEVMDFSCDLRQACGVMGVGKGGREGPAQWKAASAKVSIGR